MYGYSQSQIIECLLIHSLIFAAKLAEKSEQITRKLHFINGFTFDFYKVTSDVYAIFYT